MSVSPIFLSVEVTKGRYTVFITLSPDSTE